MCSARRFREGVRLGGVPREILKWVLMKKGVSKLYVNVIGDIY